MPDSQALITNDAAVLGLLSLILGAVFWTERSTHPFWRGLYKYVPALLLCYFVPSLFNTFGVIDAGESNLYFVASRYLLPACLVLLTMSTDLPAVLGLGHRAVIMFLTGTVGVIIGGPVAILLVSLVSPETVGGNGPDAVWRGMTTIAGSWIGGGANQAAMKEVFNVGDELFSQMIAVDVLCANVWMAVLLFFSGRAAGIDEKLGADTRAIEELKTRVQKFHDEHARETGFHDLMIMVSISFGVTGLAPWVADWIAPAIALNAPALERFSLTSEFFWIVVIATTAGVVLSFTRARNLEGAGASRVGSAFLYILIATIGMNMNIAAVLDNPGLFAVGGIWIGLHALLMIVVARLIRAPLFYLAVGSQANIGGAASAPVVAAAFHPSLASVGVLLAVLGYTLGTYGAWLCGQLMRVVAPGGP
ncbi:MAG TPA: DUF819 family protein [Gammaproteobacteria bacterium]|nr:DUF819 family protein [Gammaproteobacteria bacterium]